MNDAPIDAAALRRAFDESFATVPATPVDLVELLAIRVGGHEHALRVRDITGLHPCPPITRLPSALPELAGVAGLRGALVPVFDLQALLGLGRSASPRWMVMIGEPMIGLAFDELETQLRVPASALVTSAGATTDARTTWITGAGARPVLDLTAMHEAIARRARAATAPKENER